MTERGADWSQGEIVRTLERLALTMERIEHKVDGLDGKFVSREIHARDLAHITGRVDEMGLSLADLSADYTRYRKEQAERTAATWRSWVIPVVVVIIAALVGALVTQGGIR